ncbi:hypothetical protein LZ32DRAFT_84972 [Colletotrichum eremochloae]|nr:hypothetical protein LZ32DRAFT_84972 [Colletotrichum eremochloae]
MRGCVDDSLTRTPHADGENYSHLCCSSIAFMRSLGNLYPHVPAHLPESANTSHLPRKDQAGSVSEGMKNGNHEHVAELICNGADIFSRVASREFTTLHLAVSAQCEETTRLLIARTARRCTRPPLTGPCAWLMCFSMPAPIRTQSATTEARA